MAEAKIRIKYSKHSIRMRMDNLNLSFITPSLNSPSILFSNKRMPIQILDHNQFIVKILSEDKPCKMYHLTIFKEGCLSQCLIICTKTLRIQYQSTSLMIQEQKLKVGLRPLIFPLLPSRKFKW